MSEDFSKISKDIANDFIQSIVVIDDEAFKNPTSTLASDISRAFAKKGKVCAIYAPEKRADLDAYGSVFQKADVVVLDWLLEGVKSDEHLDPEQDIEEELGAQYTLSLLQKFIEAGNGALRLLIIYTAESALLDIAKRIHAKFNEKLKLDSDDCSLLSVDRNLKIVVRSKQDEKRSKDVMSVGYEGLPDLILEQFTSMTEGLLSNFALRALTVIRENTSRILALFPPTLDAAYLGHRILLPDANDGKHLLVRLFGELIAELLEDGRIDTSSWIKHWVHSRDLNRVQFKLEGDKFVVEQWPEFITSLMSLKEKNGVRLRDILFKNTKFIRKECIELHTDRKHKVNVVSKKDCEQIEKNAYFLFDGNKKSALEFAKLTHHKSLSLSNLSDPPRLTLGSVVRVCKKSEQPTVKGNDSDGVERKREEEFYVCIQQKCDSVRLLSKECRRFLFLPLSKESGKLPIVVGDEVMKVDLKSYKLRTIKFESDKEAGAVIAKKHNDKWIFVSTYHEEFQWLFDLKETHALRILNRYCFVLSRVGLDESEWLRRLSDNKMD